MTNKPERLYLKCPLCSSDAIEYTQDPINTKRTNVTFWCPNFHCKVAKITFYCWDTGRFVDRIKEIKR